MINLNSRPWCPFGWITVSGLLLSPQHVAKVCKQEQFNAACVTTQAINRMMQP